MLRNQKRKQTYYRTYPNELKESFSVENLIHALTNLYFQNIVYISAAWGSKWTPGSFRLG